MKKQLLPCPDSPNCVSTLSLAAAQQMEALFYAGDPITALHRLRSLVSALPRFTLIDETPDYLHYEVKTRIGNFIDDVEFRLDTERNRIDFRSASRVGYHDLGANKRRMQRIQQRWNEGRTR